MNVETPVNEKSSAAESVMLERLVAKTTEFYKNPKNLQAFKAWQKKKKENLYYGSNYTHT